MEKLIEALRSGNYRIDACRAAGIHYNTVLAWEKKGDVPELDLLSEFSEGHKPHYSTQTEKRNNQGIKRKSTKKEKPETEGPKIRTWSDTLR
jgi:hypothetical protein